MAQGNLNGEQATLSADIKLLGNLLGDIIKEQEGEAAFDLVERVRAIAKARRNQKAGASEELRAIIAETDLEQKGMLT
jgi:phosphoenolpyruvate carboxylase